MSKPEKPETLPPEALEAATAALPDARTPFASGAEDYAAPPLAWVRIECLKLAVEMRTANVPARTIITTAREFEVYVCGGVHPAGPEAE